MPIDVSRLWRQVALGEDTDLELKEARFRGSRAIGPRRDDLADELAAFANARGGRLVLGVSDDRQPQSLDPAQLDALANLVTEICSDSIKPPLDFSILQSAGPGTGGRRRAGRRDSGERDGAPVSRRTLSPAGRHEAADGFRGGPPAVPGAGAVRRGGDGHPGRAEHRDRQLAPGAVAPVRELAHGRTGRDRSVEVEVPEGRPARRAAGDGRRRAAGGGRRAGVVAERVDPGGVLWRRPHGRGPAARRAGRCRPARRADSRGGALRGPQSAGCGVQGSGAYRRAAVQRTRRLRGGGQRGRASRLRGVGVADTPVHVRRSTGAVLARRAVQFDDHRRPAHQPIHAQRAAGVPVGSVPGGRRAGRGRAAVLHRTARRRHRRHSGRNVRPCRRTAGLRVDRRAGAEGRAARGAAAGVRRRRGSRRGQARRHGSAAAGCPTC